MPMIRRFIEQRLRYLELNTPPGWEDEYDMLLEQYEIITDSIERA